MGPLLDDCEIPLDEEKVQPEELHSILNSIHPKETVRNATE